MKKAMNNEVDLLLRTLAKSPPAGVSAEGSASEESPGGEHLDADELNSYAEGVLPAITRVRYTGHIADCKRCRSLVSQLSLAAGAGLRNQVTDQENTTTFWQKVSAFFSPPVLQYAVPALALFAVIAVSIVALRQQTKREFVAQNQPINSAPAQTEVATAQTESQVSQEKKALAAGADQSSPQPQAGTQAQANDKATDSDKRQAGRAAGSVDSNSAPVKESPQFGEGSGAVARPSYAPEPATAAPPPPRSTLADAERTEESAKTREQPSERDAALKRDDAQARAKDEAAADRVTAAKTENRPVAGRSTQGLRANDARRADEKAKKQYGNEADTRSIAGRHFRRQGSVWIDTAYESSHATVNIARGSEQFRALVADEPGIRTITEQLAGELVVVWKGRAYRIR